MTPKSILVVEDDLTLTKVIVDTLKFEGFEVRSVSDGNAALLAARDFSPDLVLLDVMLPGQDGFSLCAKLREMKRMPIIMLTARSEKADKLRGLQIGADDYITKPFDLEELIARIHVVLRRSNPSLQRIVLGDVTIDFRKNLARRGHHTLVLTHREFEVLQYLAERPNQVVSRRELLRAVWHYSEDATTRAVDHAIARLRRKIERDPHAPEFIHTAHGDGYSLAAEHLHAVE